MAELLLEAGVAFTVLAAAGVLAVRFGQSVIPAYILIGMMIGPHAPEIGGYSLTLVYDRQFIDILAELGIVFLLFFLGLEFSIDKLLTRRSQIARLGAVDFAVNFGIGLAIAFAFGFTMLESFVVAGIVYISSSAVITKSLIDLGWIADPESEAILGTLVFEDLLIAIYLAVLSAMVLGGGDLANAALSVGIAFVFLTGLTLISFYGTEHVERLFDFDSDELFLLGVVGATVLISGAALALGVSEAVAAFFVGTAFSQTRHVERIENIVSPARDLFAAVFFLSIGLTTDARVLPSVIGLLALATLLSVAGKLFSGTVGAHFYGLDRRRAIRVGCGMIPRGEFSLIIATLAAGAGTTAVMQETIPAFTVGYVLAMSVIGTIMMQYADDVTKFTKRSV